MGAADPTCAAVGLRLGLVNQSPEFPIVTMGGTRGGPVTQSQPTNIHPGTFAFSGGEKGLACFSAGQEPERMRPWRSWAPSGEENLPKVEKGSLLSMLFAYLAPDLPKAKLFLDFLGICINLFLFTFHFLLSFFCLSTTSSIYLSLPFRLSQSDLSFCPLQSKFPN